MFAEQTNLFVYSVNVLQPKNPWEHNCSCTGWVYSWCRKEEYASWRIIKVGQMGVKRKTEATENKFCKSKLLMGGLQFSISPYETWRFLRVRFKLSKSINNYLNFVLITMAFNLKNKVESTTFVCIVWGVVVQLLSHV